MISFEKLFLQEKRSRKVWINRGPLVGPAPSIKVPSNVFSFPFSELEGLGID